MSRKLPAGWMATGEFDPTVFTDAEINENIVAAARSASMMMLETVALAWTVPDDIVERLAGDPHKTEKAEAVRDYLTTLARLLNEQERRWDTEDGASRDG